MSIGLGLFQIPGYYKLVDGDWNEPNILLTLKTKCKNKDNRGPNKFIN